MTADDTIQQTLVYCHTAESHSNGRYSRRRPSVGSTRANAEDATGKSDATADATALASIHTEENPQRRVYTSDGENYPYGNLEINLIRPESEKPVHTQITAKYTTSLSAARPYDSSSLEDAETAEEYVAKAMKLRFGTRLREPIRIVSTESAAIQSSSHAATAAVQTNDESGNDGEDVGQRNNKYEYYNIVARQQQQQQQQQQEQQKQQQHQQQQETQQFAGNRKAILGAQIRAQLQAQNEQAQQQVESQQQLEHQRERGQLNFQNSAGAQQSAPNYSQEPVTRSYEVYDHSINSYESNGDSGVSGGAGAAAGAVAGANSVAASDGTDIDGVDRHYRTKYLFHPAYNAGSTSSQPESESEQLRVSASTEIPKAEIMKQIEKSVMKYMKELEAEGKILTAPQEAPPKSYYKMVTTVPTGEKHATSTTVRPKYSSTTPAHNTLYGDGSTTHSTHRTPAQGTYSSSSRHHLPKQHGKSAQRYQSEAETSYQTSAGTQQSHDIGDALAPNVEFVYKIKTRAPLQTATVKTVSKPYTLPLKGIYDQFDHTSVLKNMEDFDLSHAVDKQEPDERPTGVTVKPSKLYFNSEIYHDINSLPFKSEKSHTLAAAAAAEYRKLKASNSEVVSGSEYKGYSGYFAEPAQPAETTDEKETSILAGAQTSDDGYPVMNPYQYVLKKEPLPSKYEEASSSWMEAHAKPIYTPLSAAAQKGLEYDSYSPKFNNNPEGYGYQHAYKHEREPQHGVHKYGRLSNGSSGKRGKRGGGLPYPNVSKKGLRGAPAKDIEANLALRPPPKN
ncbi:uncharacterized protein [Eurosta solidaginis]|uniref:uncharacterized protein n=1 Tax=Eurosta solidaginis TaxID=178769 RepID=UPI003530F63F